MSIIYYIQNILYTRYINRSICYCQLWITALRTCRGSTRQNSKKAVRTITYSNYIAHSEPLLKELNLLKVKDLFELKNFKFLFKLYHNNLPPYFNSYRSHLEKNVTP